MGRLDALYQYYRIVIRPESVIELQWINIKSGNSLFSMRKWCSDLSCYVTRSMWFRWQSQWFPSLFRCRIATLNFSMGWFNITSHTDKLMNKTYWDCQFPFENDIAFIWTVLHINRSLHHWSQYDFSRNHELDGIIVSQRLFTSGARIRSANCPWFRLSMCVLSAASC